MMSAREEKQALQALKGDLDGGIGTERQVLDPQVTVEIC